MTASAINDVVDDDDSTDSFYAIDAVDHRMDIIGQLNGRYGPPLALILNYLPAVDLCRMVCVCTAWKAVVCADPVANHRRVRHVKRVRKLRKSVGQENWPIKGRTPTTRNSRTALSNIQNVYQRSTRSSTKRSTQSTHTITTTSSISTPNTRQSQRLRDMGLRGMR